jgi:hypothetical protein
MRHWPVATTLMLMLTLIPTLPARAQQKPFTQDQVQTGSHSQRISDCGLFSRLRPQFEGPRPHGKFTFLARKNPRSGRR